MCAAYARARPARAGGTCPWRTTVRKAVMHIVATGNNNKLHVLQPSEQYLQTELLPHREPSLPPSIVFLCQRLTTATSSPDDDVHCYVIPPKVTRFYFQQTSVIHVPVGKRKGCSLSSRSSAPIADSFHVATMARNHSVLNLREINRNNTYTALP
jgi:hypothetical protein